MSKIYYRRILELTKGEYDTLRNMLAQYRPAYLDYEDIDKKEARDWENAKKIRAMFGVK